MLLANLPEDLLALLLTGDLSWVAIALWKAGNRQLMSKMSNGGVRDLILVLHPKPDSFDVVWPQCLKHFRLRSLSVSWRHSSACPFTPPGETLRAELRQLWKGITHLTLIGKSAEKVFLHKLPPKPKKPKKSNYSRKGPVKRAKISEYDDVSDTIASASTPITDTWIMSETLPNLTRLTISTGNPAKNGKFNALSIRSFDVLPRGLVYLDLSECSFTLYAEDCEKMPSTLRTLILPHNAVTEDNITSMPTSLKHIDSADRKSRCYTHEALKLKFNDETGSILPNLLELGVSLFPSHFSELYTDIGETWSLPIKELQVLIPPQDFRTPTSRAFFEFPVHSRMFPATLTRLKTCRLDWDAIPDSSIWSPSLTHLELETLDCIHNGNFPKLPRGLVTLRWYGPGQLRIRRPYGGDPDTLDSGRLCLEDIDAARWTRVRAKLNAYGDTLLDKDRREELEDYISEVERGALFGLPVTLEELSFRFVYCYELTMGLLPPLATHAEIMQRHTNHISPVSLVPPFLTSLRLNMYCTQFVGHYEPKRIKGLLFSNVRELDLVYNGFPRDARFLPNRLHRLTLNLPIELSPHMFSLLPTSLRHLAAIGHSISKEGWRDAIPAQLETFSLSSYPQYRLLSEEDINDLREQLAIQGTQLRFDPLVLI